MEEEKNPDARNKKKKIDTLIISEILTIKKRMRHWRKYLQYFKPTKDQIRNSLIQKENRKKQKREAETMMYRSVKKNKEKKCIEWALKT